MGGVNIYLHGFLTSKLDGCEWSALHSACFITGERVTYYPLNRELGSSLLTNELKNADWCVVNMEAARLSAMLLRGVITRRKKYFVIETVG
jgi:hypothetical protein